MSGMGRVRLTAGGVSPGQVRLKPSGASERLRRLEDDINYTTRPGESCRVCRRRAAVPESGRLKLCQVCTPDGRIVADVAAALKAARQPPLTAVLPAGSPLHQLRARGLKAQARLDSRRRSSKEGTAAKAQKPGAPTGARGRARRTSRRLNDQDKKSGAQRIRARILGIEQRLRQAHAMRPHARAKLEDELAAARRLLARWDDTH
jgi:hypothetical protein